MCVPDPIVLRVSRDSIACSLYFILGVDEHALSLEVELPALFQVGPDVVPKPSAVLPVVRNANALSGSLDMDIDAS